MKSIAASFVALGATLLACSSTSSSPSTGDGGSGNESYRSVCEKACTVAKTCFDNETTPPRNLNVAGCTDRCMRETDPAGGGSLDSQVASQVFNFLSSQPPDPQCKLAAFSYGFVVYTRDDFKAAPDYAALSTCATQYITRCQADVSYGREECFRTVYRWNPTLRTKARACIDKPNCDELRQCLTDVGTDTLKEPWFGPGFE